MLRAVAVVLVLLYHLKIPGFSSGFLGVDVFFVISGYLMQALYGQGVGAREFYKRRARRLLPAYFGLIIFNLGVCAFATLPGEFSETIRQSLWASLLSSNIGYWADTSYFEAGQFRPLLHLWSLGVEAQFYLVFPLLLRINRRWFAIASLLSLAACFLAVTISPKLSFFMMPLRIWEFALGMFAARTQLQLDRKLGLAALCGVILTLAVPIDGAAPNILTGHPAFPALVMTTLTACALIARFPQAFERSWPGVVAQRVGDASYSLYLAHFPVIALLNYKPFGGTRLGLTPLAIPLIVVATLALYFGLERRGPRYFSVGRSFASVAAIWIASLVMAPLQISRFSEQQRLIFAAARDRSTYRCGKLFRVLHPMQKFCVLGRGRPIMLVGDSHADALKTSLARVSEKHGWQLYFAVDNAPLRSSALTPQALRREADARGVRWIFLHYSSRNFTPELVEGIRRQVGRRLIVIEPTPLFAEPVPKSLYEGRVVAPQAQDPKLEVYLKSHPEIPVMRVMSTLCSPRCRLADGAGRPLYWDRDHLTLTGARTLEPTFDRFYGTIIDRRDDAGHPSCATGNGPLSSRGLGSRRDP